MVHLSINERLKVVGIYYEILTTRTTDKFKMISAIVKFFHLKIVLNDLFMHVVAKNLMKITMM